MGTTFDARNPRLNFIATETTEYLPFRLVISKNQVIFSILRIGGKQQNDLLLFLLVLVFPLGIYPCILYIWN